ncbi:putative E3 ubiquitin-protein ligase RHG1A [Gossypium australe]|uniref:Putative E3 ubiquitin-protein ligase RHG1A n=1 Tax=Gossypium australe TaxID=47621 RepID=A0A5B6UCS2_9ROSI|nr:putative E3 ubiquitin-protein ligase RHG1A [Gossypium australe]
MFVKFGLRYGASDMAFVMLSIEEKSLELGFIGFCPSLTDWKLSVMKNMTNALPNFLERGEMYNQISARGRTMAGTPVYKKTIVAYLVYSSSETSFFSF